MARLKGNQIKSIIYMARVNEQTKRELLSITGFHERNLSSDTWEFH